MVAGSSVSIALSVNRLMTLLNSHECSADALSTELARMSIDMEAGRFSALALIADTAANGCRNSKMPWADIQAATLELCERLLEAAKTDEPFSFQDAPPALLGLLFPEPEPAPRSQPKDEGPVETTIRLGNAIDYSQPGNNQSNNPANAENGLKNSKLVQTACDCKILSFFNSFWLKPSNTSKTLNPACCYLSNSQAVPKILTNSSAQFTPSKAPQEYAKLAS